MADRRNAIEFRYLDGDGRHRSVSRDFPLPVDATITSDALTDDQLRAAPVEVSGSFSLTQDQPLTDTQLRAAAVSVDTGLVQPVTPGDSVDVGNLPATYPDQHDQPLTDTQLRATHLKVADDYTQGEILADQTAPAGGAVLTFTFSATVHGIWIAAVDPADLAAIGEVRVAPFGGTPSPSFGIPVPYGSPFPVPVTTPTVKVYADGGVRVTLVGNIR